jgi:hypothetical protein
VSYTALRGAEVKKRMEKIEKSVKIRNTVYEVRVMEDRIEAEETTYPLPGYGNYVSTKYIVDLGYSKAWAKYIIECVNQGYACRGQGQTAGWVDLEDYARKEGAKKLWEAVRAKLETAEDGTPDVKEVFDMVALESKFNP